MLRMGSQKSIFFLGHHTSSKFGHGSFTLQVWPSIFTCGYSIPHPCSYVPVRPAQHTTASNVWPGMQHKQPVTLTCSTLQNSPWFTTSTTSEPTSHSFPVSRIREEQCMVTCRHHLVTRKMCRCKHEPCVQVCGDNEPHCGGLCLI